MEEIWKDIEGYEGIYQISNLGRVKSLHNKLGQKELIMKQNLKRNGYYQIRLKNNGTQKDCIVHRLVAKTFIPNPNNYLEINHKDENKQNNNVNNLEWCNRKYNMNYGTLPQRINEKNKKPVVGYNDNIQVKLNFIRYGNKYGYNTSSIIKSIKTGNLYKGLKWRYCDGDK